MVIRELEKVRQLFISSTGLDLGYAYDDLVFAEHAIFIARFSDDDASVLHIHFNNDCLPDDKVLMQKSLIDNALPRGFKIHLDNNFKMKQKEATEEIEIEFC